jgi:hypothetical protein
MMSGQADLFSATDPAHTRCRIRSCIRKGSMTEARVVRLLRAACREAGSQSAWAYAHGVRPQYVSAVLLHRQHPGPQIVRALGLREITNRRRQYAEAE